MCGEYTDYNSYTVDKWNMQTIPGRDLTIKPSEIVQLVTNDGKEDVYAIVNNFYEIYKTNVPKEQQTKFDLLDGFIEYTNEKKQTKEEPEEFNFSEETQKLIDQAKEVVQPTSQNNNYVIENNLSAENHVEKAR